MNKRTEKPQEVKAASKKEAPAKDCKSTAAEKKASK